MKKNTVSKKIAISMILVLFVSFAIIQSIISKEFKDTTLNLSEENLNMLSLSIAQTIQATMNSGDSAMINKSIQEAAKINGVNTIDIYRANSVSEIFGLEQLNIKDQIIADQFNNPKDLNLNIENDNGHFLRLIRPFKAKNECITCHANAKEGDVLGVMDLTYSYQWIDEDLSEKRNIFIATFVLALLITTVVVLLMLRSIVGKPISELSKKTKDLSQGEGNLTARIQVKSNDEIGQVCHDVNKFIEKTQDTIKTVKDIAHNVEMQTKDLGQSAKNLFESSKEDKKQAKTSNELTKSVGKTLEISKNISIQASSSNKESYIELEEMIINLKDVVSKVNTASSKEQEMVYSIKSVVTQTEEIRKVLEMIQDVSDQTNLLALNAGIEAARAGENGRGFAVVAEEIRILAEKSENSLDEIGSITKKIVESINELSKDLKANAASIVTLSTDANSLMNKAESTKERTLKSIEMSNDVEHKAIEIGESLEKLLDEMDSLVTLSDRNEEISNSLMQVVENLKNASMTLEKDLSKFKV